MCEIKKIIITCNNNKTKNEFDENYKDSPQRNDIKMNITDLKPYQNYNCAGIIQNSNGNSTKSNEIHFQTEPDGILVNKNNYNQLPIYSIFKYLPNQPI